MGKSSNESEWSKNEVECESHCLQIKINPNVFQLWRMNWRQIESHFLHTSTCIEITQETSLCTALLIARVFKSTRIGGKNLAQMIRSEAACNPRTPFVDCCNFFFFRFDLSFFFNLKTEAHGKPWSKMKCLLALCLMENACYNYKVHSVLLDLSLSLASVLWTVALGGLGWEFVWCYMKERWNCKHIYYRPNLLLLCRNEKKKKHHYWGDQIMVFPRILHAQSPMNFVPESISL